MDALLINMQSLSTIVKMFLIACFFFSLVKVSIKSLIISDYSDTGDTTVTIPANRYWY
jgi:hypothetical protein